MTKEPIDYVTIDYHNGKNGPITGSLKIVVLDEEINTSSANGKGIFPDNGGFANKGLALDVQNAFRSVYYTITTTDVHTSEYPLVWKHALNMFSKGRGKTANSVKIWGCET